MRWWRARRNTAGQDVSPEWEEGETGGGVIKEGFNGGTHQLEYVDPFVLAK